MKILILGSEGFVGHNLVNGLRKNHEVQSADQIENDLDKNYSRFNIMDYDDVEMTVRDVDVVINLVAHPYFIIH
jgi:nucleoside-diphosphate-sugar epimerase